MTPYEEPGILLTNINVLGGTALQHLQNVYIQHSMHSNFKHHVKCFILSGEDSSLAKPAIVETSKSRKTWRRSQSSEEPLCGSGRGF